MNPTIIAKLQSVTPKEDISFKPQGKPLASRHGPGYVCRAVPYVDARFVMQRLDDAVGAEYWATDVKNVGGLVAVGIGIFDQDAKQWVWKWDTGMEGNLFRAGADGQKGDKRDDIAFKGLISNGLKRAANQWGIGRDTYNIGIRWAPCEVYPDNPEKWKAWLPEGKPHQANGSTKKAGPGSFEHLAQTQDATLKIIKVLTEKGGMTEKDALGWVKEALARTDGSLDAYRSIYKEAVDLTGA
jgi:hypothetical protein